MDRIRKYLFYLGYDSSYSPTLTGSQEFTCDPVMAWTDQYNAGDTSNEVMIQAILLFLASGGMTFFYLLWTDQFGIFTVLMPFLVGGIVTLAAFVAICAASPTDCVTTLLGDLWSFLWKGVWKLLTSLF